LQQHYAPEHARINFWQISNHIHDKLIKTVVIFASSFMHYKFEMPLLQGNEIMYCDIQIFPSSTTAEALLHFSLQKLSIVECPCDMQ